MDIELHFQWNQRKHGFMHIKEHLKYILLCVVIVIIKLIKPISEEYLSLINVFLGIVFLIIPIPIIENELKNKFK